MLDKESSDESEEEVEFNSTVGSKRDLMVPQEAKKKSSGGFFKQAKKAFPMFPYIETKIKWDEYGEIFK